MLFFSSYKIFGNGYPITFLSSYYSPSRRQFENFSNAFNGNFLTSQVCGFLCKLIIANHLHNHKQIGVYLIKLAHVNEPCFLHPLCFSLLHCPYHAMHAPDKINRLKIFRLNWVVQLFHLSAL